MVPSRAQILTRTRFGSSTPFPTTPATLATARGSPVAKLSVTTGSTSPWALMMAVVRASTMASRWPMRWLATSVVSPTTATATSPSSANWPTWRTTVHRLDALVTVVAGWASTGPGAVAWPRDRRHRMPRMLRRGARVPGSGRLGSAGQRQVHQEQPTRGWQGQQLSGGDASFLYFETPNAPGHIFTCSIYDPSTAPGGRVTFKQILDHYRSRLHVSRTFRQKLVQVPMGLDHPYWIEAPAFDLE